jgi:hypothetical protein
MLRLWQTGPGDGGWETMRGSIAVRVARSAEDPGLALTLLR